MKLWEILEQWLIDNDVEAFTNRSLATYMDVTPRQASAMIQSYLDAQRSSHTNTLYVLKREGRTTLSVWTVGERVADVRAIGVQFGSDVKTKALRAFAPDLEAIAMINPRAARKAEQTIHSVVDGALVVLEAAVRGNDI